MSFKDSNYSLFKLLLLLYTQIISVVLGVGFLFGWVFFKKEEIEIAQKLPLSALQSHCSSDQKSLLSAGIWQACC